MDLAYTCAGLVSTDLRCIVYSLNKLTHQIRSRFFLWLKMGILGFLVFGCQRPSSSEKILDQFLQAVEKNDMVHVWKGLDNSSQKAWTVLAHRMGYQNGKQLFVSGNVWKLSRLRRDPANPPKRETKKTLLFFRDELEQPVRVVLIRENASWRVVLPAPSQFQSSPPTTQPFR